MNTPIRAEQFYGPDEQSSDHSKYAPKRPRPQQQAPRGDRPYVNSGPMAPNEYQDRRMAAEFASRPESVPEPPPLPMEDSTLGLVGRITMVVSVAAVVALLAIFAKPIAQGARALFSDTPTADASKPSDRLTVNSEVLKPSDRLTPNVVPPKPAASGAVVATASGELPPTSAPAQQQPAVAAVTPPQTQEPRGMPFRGVTDTEIRFGIAAPFTGPAKELGQNMRLGIETAFRAANANGGIFGRPLPPAGGGVRAGA